MKNDGWSDENDDDDGDADDEDDEGGLRLGEHSHLGNQQLELNKLISVSHFAPPLPRGSAYVQATIYCSCTGQLIHFKGQRNWTVAGNAIVKSDKNAK